MSEILWQASIFVGIVLNGEHMKLRLDKFLAEMGLGTRTEVKKIIKTGQITVNGNKAGKPEIKVDTEADCITYQGKELKFQEFSYYLLHKPAGCVSATEDNLHKTVMDYLPKDRRSDLFPVGRLDIDTEGLLLITNDGALAHELLSPAKHIEKTYYAKIAGRVTEDDVNQFLNGVDIGEDKPTKPGKLVILKSDDISEIELTITEGKFHQVKRMFLAVEKEVVYLRRISMGPLRLTEDLKPGTYRELTPEELAALKNHKES